MLRRVSLVLAVALSAAGASAQESVPRSRSREQPLVPKGCGADFRRLATETWAGAAPFEQFFADKDIGDKERLRARLRRVLTRRQLSHSLNCSTRSHSSKARGARRVAVATSSSVSVQDPRVDAANDWRRQGCRC